MRVPSRRITTALTELVPRSMPSTAMRARAADWVNCDTVITSIGKARYQATMTTLCTDGSEASASSALP